MREMQIKAKEPATVEQEDLSREFKVFAVKLEFLANAVEGLGKAGDMTLSTVESQEGLAEIIRGLSREFQEFGRKLYG